MIGPEAVRTFILTVGWPGLVVGSLLVLRGALLFYQRVQGSVFGKLVLLMIVGWLESMYSLAVTATSYMVHDADAGVPIVFPVFLVWGVTMFGISYVVWKWSKEAVTLNALYSDLEGLVHQRTQALADSLDRERQLEQARLQLLSLVAHDMVTPVATIGMEMDLLRSEGPRRTADEIRSLDRVSRNLDYLRKLVEDVRGLGKRQTGTLRLSMADVDLPTLLREVVASFEPRARARGLRLHAAAAEGLHVRGDAQRLKQVLYNLISNAMKFTAKGGSVQVEAHPEGNDAVFRVLDTGQGLSEGDLGRLFQPFSPGPEPTHGERGTGLGLYICKAIVTQHGGRIWAESPGPGRGSTFSVALPRVHEPQTPSPAATASASAAGDGAD